MSVTDTYINNPTGRTMIISFLASALLLFIAIMLPLAPYDPNAWYAFLYQDITLDPEERYNFWLVILEVIAFTLFYFFFVVALASYAELNNRLPSWGELIIAATTTLIGAWIVPQISVGEATIQGTGGSGFNHFTTNMQLTVLISTVVTVVLVTLYLFYSAPQEEME